MSSTICVRIAALGWLLVGLPAEAQHWSFQNYGPDLGLTNPTILALHQDREGYLWVSTEGGIFRYDGDRFRPFPVKSGTKTGHTFSLYSSPDGQLWAGSSAPRQLHQWATLSASRWALVSRSVSVSVSAWALVWV